jgi:hypothetical protein
VIDVAVAVADAAVVRTGTVLVLTAVVVVDASMEAVSMAIYSNCSTTKKTQ